jgi:hypothetical protein
MIAKAQIDGQTKISKNGGQIHAILGTKPTFFAPNCIQIDPISTQNAVGQRPLPLRAK